MYSGLFPSRLKTLAPKIWLHKLLERIRSFLKLSKIWNPPYFKSALPHSNVFTGYTKIYFAENRLYLSLISLSLLITSIPIFCHRYEFGPPVFKPSACSWLDHSASDIIFLTLTLFKACVNYVFKQIKLAKKINSLAHYAKGTLSL